MKLKDFLPVLLIATATVVSLDLITNSLDIVHYSWDFKYYINLAENGFNPNPLLISPFAYRYPTPFIASGFISIFHVSMEEAFRMVAYMGAILQLISIYFIAFHFYKRRDIAFASMFIVAFSFMNVKFILFDVYRPDHFAYSLVTLAIYFALSKKYFPLLITSCIAVQFREFGILPLFSYWLFMLWKKDWKQIVRLIFPTAVAMFVAVALPRLLIEVQGSMQFVSSNSGVMRTVKYFLSPKRNTNLIYDTVAYFLPVLILFTNERWKKLKETGDYFKYIACFFFFVLLLSYGGGGDLMRFVTFYATANVLIAGFFMKDASKTEIAVALSVTFLFNRIWAQVPMDTIDHYLNFLCGHNTIINIHSVYRALELMILVVGGRWILNKIGRGKDPSLELESA